MTTKTGLDALLRPDDGVLVLIDHQPFQVAKPHGHEPTLIVNNVIGLAKAAKAFGVPTRLTTVLEERCGYLIKGLLDVFPEQKPIDRTSINTWQDQRVVDEVKSTGHNQLVLAATWTEVCLAIPAIQALAEGYEYSSSPIRRAAFLRKRTTWRRQRSCVCVGDAASHRTRTVGPDTINLRTAAPARRLKLCVTEAFDVEAGKMIESRSAAQRGRREHGWPNSRHTDSFADHYDARY